MLQVYLALLDTEDEKRKFTDIYDRYRGLMFAVAQKYFDSSADQEQIVDEALHAILGIVRKIDNPTSTKTKNLMALITRNKCIDLLRKRGGTVVEETDEVPDLPADADNPAQPDLSCAIASLNETGRDMIGLRYYYGYSTREIAKLLGISHDAARKRLEKAHKDLRKLLVENE